MDQFQKVSEVRSPRAEVWSGSFRSPSMSVVLTAGEVSPE